VADPTYRITAERRDAMVAVVHAVVGALLVGRADR
jgi:hypothetical protein